MKIINAVPESVAIGEFLRNEFYEPEFNRDRDKYEQLVLHPDYEDANENALRRALLYRRRGHMWRELPSDTQWFEVEVEQTDLDRIRVFPRAQWRKISNGSFCIGDVVQRIRESNYRDGGDRVIAKIQMMRYRLKADAMAPSTVLLIGLDHHSPLTILEGNHRLAAAMLVSPEMARTHFRVFVGLSPRMAESCWYQTNFSNLWRYIKNRAINVVDREADVTRITPQVQPAAAALGAATLNKATQG
jgi:hypothetical protein